MSNTNKKILIIAHGHPDINKGGAEMAAYNLFQEMLRQGEDVYFLARTDLTPHGGAAFSTRNSPREILFHTTMDDWFLFSNIKTRHLWQEFRDLLKLIKPDVVHFHHYFLLGIETIQEVRNTLPDSKILLTLHEYLAICHNKGLMVKTNGKLCYKASARDCHGCFPDRQPGDFLLREQYIKRIFENVDVFISPSEFLKQRYLDWGMPERPFEVIENGQVSLETQTMLEQTREDDNDKVRFAFFGQINPYKGLDVLLEAFLQLPKKIRKQVSLEIHGANLNHQSSAFQSKISKLLKKFESNVKMYGTYENHEMPRLLNGVDWVIIPSIWWENSPMVIQEAFNNRVPLIVSDIGGMAEKVIDGINGVHFRAGKSMDLAEVIQNVVDNPKMRQDMQAGIKTPLSINDCVKQHLTIYTS